MRFGSYCSAIAARVGSRAQWLYQRARCCAAGWLRTLNQCDMTAIGGCEMMETGCNVLHTADSPPDHEVCQGQGGAYHVGSQGEVGADGDARGLKAAAGDEQRRCSIEPLVNLGRRDVGCRVWVACSYQAGVGGCGAIEIGVCRCRAAKVPQRASNSLKLLPAIQKGVLRCTRLLRVSVAVP